MRENMIAWHDVMNNNENTEVPYAVRVNPKARCVASEVAYRPTRANYGTSILTSENRDCKLASHKFTSKAITGGAKKIISSAHLTSVYYTSIVEIPLQLRFR